MSDLTTVAAEFKKWRGDLSYCRYPEYLWEKAYQLTNSHSLQDIASAIGISVQYLKRKFTKHKPLSFASVQVTSSSTPIKIEFKQVTIHTDASQVISILQNLMGGA